VSPVRLFRPNNPPSILETHFPRFVAERHCRPQILSRLSTTARGVQAVDCEDIRRTQKIVWNAYQASLTALATTGVSNHQVGVNQYLRHGAEVHTEAHS
jgi:hypothetical protein